jgi:hypothetical protein
VMLQQVLYRMNCTPTIKLRTQAIRTSASATLMTRLENDRARPR